VLFRSALARRLTELDARLGHAQAAERPVAGTEPRALPGDGPAELEAKADILSDQANRLALRAETILGRARDLRARQNLRRHVGQMERDPFSPLEGSKRRALASSASLSMPTGTKVSGAGTPPAGPPPERPGGTSTAMGTSDNSAGTAVAPQVASATPGAAAPPPSFGGATATTSGTPPSPPITTTTPSPSSSGVAVTSPHMTPSPTGLGAVEGALSSQLRDLLDPTTLAEIQRLEATGGAMSNFEALERAGAALKARAERLAQQAATLRARERVEPRAR
jgi:hypothetical protein